MSTLDMERICRLCCAIKSRTRPLFEHRPEYPLALCQMIYAIADLKVDPNDGLPQKICSQCVTSLMKIYKTIQDYRENDLILRKQLDQAKADEIALMMEIEEMPLKQEVGGEGCQGSESLSESGPMNGTHKKQDAVEERISIEQNVLVKSEPLDELDEGSQLNIAEWNVTVGVCEQPDVQQDEPLAKAKRAHQQPVAIEENKPVKKSRKAHRQSAAVQESKPVPKPKRGRRDSKIKDQSQPVLSWDEDDEKSKFYPHEDDEESDVSNQDEAADVLEPERRLKHNKTKNTNRQELRRSKTEDPKQQELCNYKCYICKSKPFETARARLLHMNSNHMDLLPFTCSECVMETVVLNTVLGLNKHLQQHLLPRKCPYCDKRFASERGVDIHVQEVHPSMADDSVQQSSLKCKQCDKEYPTKDSLRYHVRNRHFPVTCTDCGASFNGKERLRYHWRKEHDQNSAQFDCNVCQKKLSSLRTLQNHFKAFHAKPTQAFKCSYCPKAYNTNISRRSHEKRHIRNPNYIAKENWVQYYTVLEGQQDVTKKKCICNICGTITKKIVKHLLRSHFSIKLDCKICGKIFKRKDWLEKHVAMHIRTEHPVKSDSMKDEQSDAEDLEWTSCKRVRNEAGAGVGGLPETDPKSDRARRSLRSSDPSTLKN